MRDYILIAKQYAETAYNDVNSHGKWIRLAAKRFIDDLDRTKEDSCAFYFDEAEAYNACDFIEKLPHVEGKWESPYIVLHPAQVFFIVQLFGFRNKHNGGRRFTSVLYATARKSGKSTLAAAILLYCQCCEDEPGGQIISAATTFPQAAIIFNVAKKMVEREHELQNAFGLDTWAKAISRMENGSSFKPIHAKASTQDGLNPSHVGLDEIHAHKTADLLNVLTSAAGARSNPLWLYTTTEGYANPGPWSELKAFCKKMLEGVFGYTADHFLGLFWAVDDDDNEFDERCWIKANPLIDSNPHLLEAIRKEAVEARQMPSKLAEFRIKRLNRPAQTAEGWIDLPKWQACSGEVDLEWLKQYPCWIGLDLASTRDMTAIRILWKINGMYYTYGRRFVPQDAVVQRTERGTVPYASWVEAGYIEQTSGNTTDYEVIKDVIISLTEQFKVLNIAFDPWNATDLINRLAELDIPMVEFVQGTKSYHPAMQELERAYIDGKLHHGGDPVLNWCASNLISRRDQNLNLAPDKKRSADKIDDMAALLMAFGLSLNHEEETDINDFLRSPIIV